ncbi:hypothetical protein GCM10022224_008400 [Nonomuraea antimicrobica]|uniref:Amino acid adenylation domain-containing protein n=1 Tax=Nonomuraea antimicrobica TaxID=561173 RepID=A0ABP7B4U5_9ACTN
MTEEQSRPDDPATWSGPRAEIPPTTLTALIEAQVLRTPEAVALVSARTRLTYSELDARANRLARLLAARGAGPEKVIALALPRSAEALVATLAVLKTGAAYLPVEPDHPPDRIAFMLADSGCSAVVTLGPAAFSRPAVRLDDPDVLAELAGHDAAGLARRCAPDQSAYVIYTSGSTGRPKGVIITHRSVVNYLTWCVAAYPGVGGLTPLHSPLSFDLTVTGCFAPLVVGGAVRLAGVEEGSGDGEPYTFLKATPSHVPLLTALPGECSPTGQLVLGGEPLLGEVVEAWRAAHPKVTVVNEYGPTETTVGCSEYRIEPDDEVPGGVLPLGRPIFNTSMYVLDEGLNPALPGTTGELYIAGVQLARGYVNRPGLTSASFLPDPFGPPGSRMYRTGDLGRWNAAGLLEFAGRIDDQVKVRGFRIELGEVEAALAGHPEVAQAAATVAGERLIACVTLRPGSGAVPVTLRRHVARTLPGYMIPAKILIRDALPLTPNGKLDRKVLFQNEDDHAD